MATTTACEYRRECLADARFPADGAGARRPPAPAPVLATLCVVGSGAAWRHPCHSQRSGNQTTTGRRRRKRRPQPSCYPAPAMPPNNGLDRTKPNRGAQWAPRLIGFAAQPDVGWRVQSGLVDAQASSARPSNVFQPSSRACRRVSEGANAPLPTPRLACSRPRWEIMAQGPDAAVCRAAYLIAFVRAGRLGPKGPVPRLSCCSRDSLRPRWNIRAQGPCATPVVPTS